MNIVIREFTSEDTRHIARLLDNFENYLVDIDDLKFLRPFEDGGKEYTEIRLDKVKDRNGTIMVAVDEGKVIGLSLVTMDEQDRTSVLEEGERTYARVQDLYIDEKYRSKGVGKMLLNATEAWCKEKGCNVLTLGVLAPNRNAYEFYKHIGYKERAIDLIKVIQ